VKLRIAYLSLVFNRALWLKSFSIDSWIQTDFKTEILKINVPIIRRTYHRMNQTSRFCSEESTASHFLDWKGIVIVKLSWRWKQEVSTKCMHLSSNVPCLTFIKTVIFGLNYGGRRLQFNGHVLSWPQVSLYKGEVHLKTIWIASKYLSSVDRWSECRLLTTRDGYLDAVHLISTC